jgi:uncharacterized membrane protein YqjE
VGSGPLANTGLIDSAKRLARTVLGAVRTRLDLLANEIEEERLYLRELMLLLMAFGFALAMFLMLGVMFVVVLLWDTHRLLALGAFAGLFLVAAVAALAGLRAHFAHRPKIFAASIAELAKDIERLREHA